MIKVQDEMDAESSAQKEPKQVPAQELQALKMKFEEQYYKLKDRRLRREHRWRTSLSSWTMEN